MGAGRWAVVWRCVVYRASKRGQCTPEAQLLVARSTISPSKHRHEGLVSFSRSLLHVIFQLLQLGMSPCPAARWFWFCKPASAMMPLPPPPPLAPLSPPAKTPLPPPLPLPLLPPLPSPLSLALIIHRHSLSLIVLSSVALPARLLAHRNWSTRRKDAGLGEAFHFVATLPSTVHKLQAQRGETDG